MFLVRFSGFMAIPSMLRASQSTKLSISPSMLPSSSNSQLKKITAKRSVSRNSSEHYQLFQCIPWLWKIKQLVCPDLVRTTETRAHESRKRMRAVLNLLRLVQEFVTWPHVVEQADHVDITHSNLFSGGVSEDWTTLLKSKSTPGLPPWT